MLNSVQKENYLTKPETQLSVAIRNLTKLYPQNGSGSKGKYLTANDNISLEIQQGEIFGLLGPNGAGKTTLVKQILGLTLPDSGSIEVEGINVVEEPGAVRNITAYLPQQGVGFDTLEVWRALTFTGQLRGLSQKESQTQANELIEKLNLNEVSNRYIYKLSGGMYRMVGLAAALMGYPKLLVLDEPTNELDPLRRRLVWQTIQNINQERGITCILVTHNVLEAETILERLAIISEGKILVQNTPGALKQQISSEAYIDLKLRASTEIELIHSFLGNNNFIRIEPGRTDPRSLRLYIPIEQADTVLGVLLHRIGMQSLDDIKLALPSLEDVYLTYMQGVGDKE